MKGRIPGAIVVVATVAATFGVFMLQAVALLLALIGSSDAGSRARAQPMLTTVAWIFIGVAVYVSGVVTTNTVSTVITGRTRTIALLRLLGSSARTERKRIAVEGLIAGAIGGVGGLVLGTVAVLVLQQVGVGQHWWTDSLRPNYADPGVITPVLVIIGAIWLASWVGSHRVLAVRPTEALTQSVEVDQTVIRHRWVRHVIAMVLVVVGLVLLVVGVFMGRTDPRGVLPAFFGGVICFTGIVMLAPLVMPRVLRVVGCAFGVGPQQSSQRKTRSGTPSVQAG